MLAFISIKSSIDHFAGPVSEKMAYTVAIMPKGQSPEGE